MLLCLLTIPVDQNKASPWLDCAYMQGHQSYDTFIMIKVKRFKCAVTRVYNEYLDTLNVLLNIYLKNGKWPICMLNDLVCMHGKWPSVVSKWPVCMVNSKWPVRVVSFKHGSGFYMTSAQDFGTYHIYLSIKCPYGHI